jgi:hypothetical protein
MVLGSIPNGGKNVQKMFKCTLLFDDDVGGASIAQLAERSPLKFCLPPLARARLVFFCTKSRIL